MRFYAQENFKDWLKKEKQQFKEFMEKRDREFAEFLEKEWKEFELLQGIVPDKVPKPPIIPVKNFEEFNFEDIPKKNKVNDFKITPPPEKESIGIIKKPNLKFSYGKRVDFNYLNTPCKMIFDLTLERIDFSEKFDNTDISRFWSQVSRTQYIYLLDQCKTIKHKMRLNDWAFYKFLMILSNNIYPSDINKTRLLVWFLMQKFGYDVKVGYSNGRIFLLISSQNVLYNHSFIKTNNRRYYKLTSNISSNREKNIHTYDGSYPEASSMIDLNIYYCPVINPEIVNKTLIFDYSNKGYSLYLNINKAIVDFYSAYPLTEYKIYFNAPISNEGSYSLLKSLKPLIIDKSEIEAVNIILHFVQKSFKYKTDHEQFGNEKPLFIEETLYYPGSDCEDRAILFAYLIRKLVKLDVVGLDYPGHIATAVKIHTNIDGKYINHLGENYIICDPTYVNANVGQCLPKYSDVNPEIISLYNSK